jgi:hypothetical protein
LSLVAILRTRPKLLLPESDQIILGKLHDLLPQLLKEALPVELILLR